LAVAVAAEMTRNPSAKNLRSDQWPLPSPPSPSPAQRVFALLSMFCGGARLNWPRFTDNVWNPFGVM
jgi:hypothetical protein